MTSPPARIEQTAKLILSCKSAGEFFNSVSIDNWRSPKWSHIVALAKFALGEKKAKRKGKR